MGSDVNKFYFRLVLLGSNGTGKTSILNRFLFKKFEAKHKPTVEDLFTKEFDLGSIEIKVDFLDTAGSMQFPAMRRLSITNGDAFMIVYALDDESSLEVLKMCIAEIQETRKHDYQEIPIVFVGNKSDLPREQRRVTKELVSNFVYYELPRLRTKVIECSCKDNVNVDAIFRAYLGLARVSVSAYGMSAAAGGSGRGAMATIDSGSGSGRSSRQNSGKMKQRPVSAVPAATAAQELEQASAGSGPARSRHNSSGGGGGGPGATGASNPFRVALGVRKSCDASIVTSMRRISLSSKSSREQLEATQETRTKPAGGTTSNGAHSTNDKLTSDDREGRATPDASANANATLDANADANANANAEHENDYDDDDDDDDDQDTLGEHRAAGRGANQQQDQKSSIESILKAAAMQSSHSNSKLHVAHEAKPRSRSLIWRPHRKSSQTSVGGGDRSECRVS